MTHPLVERWGDVFHIVDGSWSGHDAVRHFMYEAEFETLSHIDWEDRSYHLLEFGCREPTSSVIRMLVYIMGERLIPTASEYPEVDIQKMQDPDNTWDILVADQVLEHVERPWLAADEIYRTLKPGGYAIVNTPFLHPIHLCPIDCWRIAPDGYRVLFPPERWLTVTSGMWGNRTIMEQIYHSPVSRGMTGEWLPVSSVESEVPDWDTPTDMVNPILLWNVFRKL